MRRMDDDHRALANHLLTTATAMLEDAAAEAAAGQSPRAARPALIALSRRLQAAAGDVAVIARAAGIVAAQPDHGDGHEEPPGD